MSRVTLAELFEPIRRVPSLAQVAAPRAMSPIRDFFGDLDAKRMAGLGLAFVALSVFGLRGHFGPAPSHAGQEIAALVAPAPPVKPSPAPAAPAPVKADPAPVVAPSPTVATEPVQIDNDTTGAITDVKKPHAKKHKPKKPKPTPTPKPTPKPN